MARTVKTKELVNTRLATNYGGWMYCDKCNENIGYLCYATYDKINLEYQCSCGSKGSATIDFTDSEDGQECDDELIIIKNRLCCPADNQPLITILDKKVANHRLSITCKACHKTYTKVQ